jgi:hypothetical protein
MAAVKVIGTSMPAVGDRVSIEHAGVLTSGVVLDSRTVPPGRDQVAVEFPAGGWLWVDVTLLGATPEHHRYRTSDPGTSVAAARSVDLTHGQMLVLSALAEAADYGMLDHDHEQVNGLKQDSAGKRRLECMSDGRDWVVNSGHRRRTPRGQWATVWRITPAGRAALRAFQLQGAA